MRTARRLALLGLLFWGCGYGLVGRTSNLPEDVQNIFVQPLENRTQRSQVELLLTPAIVDELVTRQRLQVVSSRERSDAVLSGAVTAFTVRPITFDSEGRATEYQITIRADMEFKRRDSGEIIWRQAQYLYQDNYEISVDEATYFNPEDETIEEVAQEFAETLVIDLLEGF